MQAKRLSRGRGRHERIATAVAVVFIVSGTGVIGTAVGQQKSLQGPAVPVESGAKWSLMHAGEPSPAPTMANAAARPSTNPSRRVIGPTMPRSKPVFLDIPAIGVHSALQHLGQTVDGALEVPAAGPHYNEAAWYRHSPTPGSLGPAIVYGHVDSAIDGPSVFFRLGELQRGDRISISRADDSIAVFKVDEVHRYAKNNFPTEVVYRDINHAGLRILTCGGAFDEAAGHYLDNIVAFASLVDSTGLVAEPAGAEISLRFGFFGFAAYRFDRLLLR